MRHTVKVLSYILISSIVTSLVFAGDNKINLAETDKKPGIRNLSYNVELQEFVEDQKQDPKIHRFSTN